MIIYRDEIDVPIDDDDKNNEMTMMKILITLLNHLKFDSRGPSRKDNHLKGIILMSL